jgi:hypothetical protein
MTVKEREPRSRLLRIVVILWTFSVLTVPGLGLVDVAASLLPDPGRATMFITAYAIVIGLVIPLCLLAQLRRPHAKIAFLREIVIVAIAFGLTSVLTLRPIDLFGAAFIGVVSLTTLLAHPRRREFLAWKTDWHTLLASLTLAGAAGWLGFAIDAAAKQRGGVLPREGFALGPDSWDTLTILGLVIALSALISAASLRDRQVFASWAGAASILYGVASLVRGSLPGALSNTWSIVVIGWGIALILFVRSRSPAVEQST